MFNCVWYSCLVLVLDGDVLMVYFTGVRTTLSIVTRGSENSQLMMRRGMIMNLGLVHYIFTACLSGLGIMVIVVTNTDTMLRCWSCCIMGLDLPWLWYACPCIKFFYTVCWNWNQLFSKLLWTSLELGVVLKCSLNFIRFDKQFSLNFPLLDFKQVFNVLLWQQSMPLAKHFAQWHK